MKIAMKKKRPARYSCLPHMFFVFVLHSHYSIAKPKNQGSAFGLNKRRMAFSAILLFEQL
jgi:hypothetical protein